MIMKIVTFAAISLAITLGGALVMIASQSPKAMSGEGGLDFDQTLTRDVSDAMPLTEVAMRDGYGLKLREYAGPEGAPLLVLVHGSGWHGLQFDGLARALSAKAHVVVPDLRGHGTAPGRRGDVDYIGQYEDDLADLIAAKRKDGQKLVLGGHSSGGGMVLRFAGGEYGNMLDGAVLLAPFLSHKAPTMRENAGGWNHVLLRRIIGLSILNTFKIKALNHLTIIQFEMPAAVLDGALGDTATTAYSYRLNTGFAPRGNYEKDIAALPNFALIAGTADEAFNAALYEPTMKAVTDKGSYTLVDGIGHLDVVDDPRAIEKMKGYLDEL